MTSPHSRIATVLFSAAASVCLLCNVAAAQIASNGDYQFETSPFMRSSAYHDVNGVGKDMSPDGAYTDVNQKYDETHTGKWYIEQQREAYQAIAAGITQNNTAAIDRGLKIFAWGWQQQQADGGFNCDSVGRSFHSTSFFVEAVAHALILLESSSYATQYAAQINAMKPALGRATAWMMRPDIETEGMKYNQPYTHRRYLVGDALGETGVLLGDAKLIAESQKFVLDGISMQNPAGYNPEKGGWDVSYHCGGVVFAERYYTTVANATIKPQLYNMLAKANAWTASRVSPDGAVDMSGDTRVGNSNSEKGPGGSIKKLAVGQVYESLAYWGQISGDANYLKLAEKIAHAPRRENTF